MPWSRSRARQHLARTACARIGVRHRRCRAEEHHLDRRAVARRRRRRRAGTRPRATLDPANPALGARVGSRRARESADRPSRDDRRPLMHAAGSSATARTEMDTREGNMTLRMNRLAAALTWKTALEEARFVRRDGGSSRMRSSSTSRGRVNTPSSRLAGHVLLEVHRRLTVRAGGALYFRGEGRRRGAERPTSFIFCATMGRMLDVSCVDVRSRRSFVARVLPALQARPSRR